MSPHQRSVLWLLIFPLLVLGGGGRSRSHTVVPPPPPTIRSIQWAEAGMVLPGQTRDLVAEVTGDITDYAWSISGEQATLVATAGVAGHRDPA